MAQQEEIVLWIDRRWRVAIEKQLKGETLQEHLDNVLDELCNRLPDQEYTRISNEIQEETRIAREAVEAARTYSAYRVMENGEARCFKVSPGEELLAAAQKLRHYLKDFDHAVGKFIGLFRNREPISPEEFQQMTVQRMENTGKVAGAFDIDFDKKEFSAVHIMNGWKTWAMHDVSVAAYHASRKEYMDTEERWQRLLNHLEGKELTSAGHLSAREFTFGDEIMEHDEKLNFYVQAEFEVDAVFGTHVLTDENDDWLNIYANYDTLEDRVCDTLDVTLCKGDGSEEYFSYPLNAAEKDVLLRKMEEYCQKQTSMNYTRELRSLGIPVIFEEQNINSIHPESEFLITIHGAFAQSESEDTSSRVRWGIQQSMRTGKANIQFKTLLGYKKGSDGEMVIVPEQAETVKLIYEMYLSGKTLRSIKESLEARGLQNAAGTTEWTTSNLRTILSDEKYCGDVLRQKTFIRDCISKQVVKNTGQRPKYLIQNHHDAIIPREQFDAVQFEMARRKAQTDRSRKSVPTGMGKYSGKYALSGLLFCGECGTAYRRVVWTQHGEKRAVWRCTSRLDYGKKYCKDSPTLDEEPLQQAVLAAINESMSDHGILTAQLTDAMEQELAPIPGESMSLGDIDRAIAELGKQFDHLLLEASSSGDAEEYAERFRAISTAMEELKRRKSNIQNIRQEQERVTKRVQAAVSVLDGLSAELTQWDDNVVYQMLEKVTVLSREMIRVTLRNGMEIEQAVEQPKRRKFI